MKIKGKTKERLYGKHIESKTEKGKYIKSKYSQKTPKDIAIDATIRAAAKKSKQKIKIETSDLREKIRKHSARASIVVIVDISGSMSADKKTNRVKNMLNHMIINSQKYKDKLTVIGFKGQSSEIIIPTTKRAKSFQKYINTITVGGTTPLASGLNKGLEILKKEKKYKEYVPIMILLTDGMPNVSINKNPILDSLYIASKLKKEEINSIIVNFERTKQNGRSFNMEMALESGGKYYDLEDLENPGLILNKIIDYERNQLNLVQ
jgi:magnesium chelatase subunit D